MKCCKCSAEIPDNSTFCMQCGVKQDIVDPEKLVALIEERLSRTNHHFSENGKLDCLRWIQEFGFDEVFQATETSLLQYLKFDKNDDPIKDSVVEVFNKIPGICANRKQAREKPYISDAIRMVGYANKKFRLPLWMEKEYKTHIERILYLYYSQYENYSDLYEGFFWKMKKADDRQDFLDEMADIIETLEAQ